MSALHPLTDQRVTVMREHLDTAIGVHVRAVLAAIARDSYETHVAAKDSEDALSHLVLDYVTRAARYLTATAGLPKSVWDAAVQVSAFQLDYENAAHTAQQHAERWAALDVMTGRIRVGVVDRLMWPDGEPADPIDGEGKPIKPALSATAADKAASGDAEYTTHKDETASALRDKDEAALVRDVSLEKLRTARDLLRALVMVNEARAGAPHITLADMDIPTPPIAG